MTVTSPEYFLLLPALALVGWFWRGLKLHSPLRAILLLLAVVTLAEPIVEHQQNSLDLYVLLDRSDSTEDLIDKGLPEWQRLLELSKPGRRDTLHLINYFDQRQGRPRCRLPAGVAPQRPGADENHCDPRQR